MTSDKFAARFRPFLARSAAFLAKNWRSLILMLKVEATE